MARFSLEIEFDVHDHSPRNHRLEIGTLLDRAKHAVAQGHACSGQITKPGASADPDVVGFWKLDETADQEIA